MYLLYKVMVTGSGQLVYLLRLTKTSNMDSVYATYRLGLQEAPAINHTLDSTSIGLSLYIIQLEDKSGHDKTPDISAPRVYNLTVCSDS